MFKFILFTSKYRSFVKKVFQSARFHEVVPGIVIPGSWRIKGYGVSVVNPSEIFYRFSKNRGFQSFSLMKWGSFMQNDNLLP